MSKNKILKIIELLKKDYPDAKIELDFSSVWQLLVAVILSAQCTDKRVNMVTPALFESFPDVQSFAECDVSELEKLIYSTGFYRSKARNIRAAANMIVEKFEGVVPCRMDDLVKLAGVGRKTANVLLFAGFGKPEGIAVDTHVIRLCGLLGLMPAAMVKKKDAVRIEEKLMKIVPYEYWGVFSYLLILNGRRVCIARRPRCGECSLKGVCDFALRKEGRAFTPTNAFL